MILLKKQIKIKKNFFIILEEKYKHVEREGFAVFLRTMSLDKIVINRLPIVVERKQRDVSNNFNGRRGGTATNSIC